MLNILIKLLVLQLKKISMKKFFVVVLILIVAILCGLFVYNKKTQNKDYTTDHITKRNLLQTVDASGTVNPVQSVNIGSQISGRIYKLYVDFNSKNYIEIKKSKFIGYVYDISTGEEVIPILANLKKDNKKAKTIKIKNLRIKISFDILFTYIL